MTYLMDADLHGLIESLSTLTEVKINNNGMVFTFSTPPSDSILDDFKAWRDEAQEYHPDYVLVVLDHDVKIQIACVELM